MKINDFFQEAYFINLDCRPERRKQFEEEVEKIGLKGWIKRYPAAVDATGLDAHDYNRHRACGKSHFNIIKHAYEKNLKNVLIFEDDAYFYNEGVKPGLEIVENALDELSKIEDWHIFYMGALIVKNDRIPDEVVRIGPHLLKALNVLTTHAWALNNRAFKRMLDYVPETDSAIDGWASDRMELTKYIAYPLAVPQREGKSDLDAFGRNPGAHPYLESFNRLKLGP